MKFIFTQCRVCGVDFFQSDEVVAFYRTPAELRRFDLDGQQPWTGMFCICHKCIRAIAELADEIED